MTEVHGVHGPQLVDTYLVNIYLPNNVAFTGVRATKAAIAGADILIGMDIISQGDFAVTNKGGVTKFSFRVPSIEHIDYVAEHAAMQEPQPSQSKSRADRRRERFRR